MLLQHHGYLLLHKVLDQIYDVLHNLFYDIINIEFNLWPWIRNMNKYGDFFLQLEIAEKYGITNVTPMSAYDVARMEGHDPDNDWHAHVDCVFWFRI